MAEVMPGSGLEEPRPAFGVSLDADLSGRADALLAVALLNGLSARNEARRIVLDVSRASVPPPAAAAPPAATAGGTP